MISALIIHSPLAPDAPADELDVLHQAEYFRLALTKLGYDTNTLPFSYDLQQLKTIVEEANPAVVVNLVETLFGDGRLVHIGPFVFEHIAVPYTGCSAHSMYLSSHKLLSKQHMKAHGISTPLSHSYHELKNAKNIDLSGAFIVKSLWEHASFGMDENKKLLFHTQEELLARFEEESNPAAFFCEQYVHGREFNLSVLGGKNGPEVLPPAEIRFSFPPDKPRILGYKAKWEEESFEYKNTIRSFDFPATDQPLLLQLKQIALLCWEVFDLKGYARVDFRVDDQGDIFVLEINANPCISPDSGFVAATSMAGLTDEIVVTRILEDAGVKTRINPS